MPDKDDIVKRLEAWHTPGETITGDVALYLEAAATITSLREELDRARKALEPFAAKAKEIGLDTPRFKNLLELTDKFTFKRSDLRAAAAAMGEDKK